MIKEVTMYQVVCDKCGRVFENGIFGSNRFYTSEGALKSAQRYGWTESNGKNLCHVCSGNDIKSIAKKVAVRFDV